MNHKYSSRSDEDFSNLQQHPTMTRGLTKGSGGGIPPPPSFDSPSFGPRSNNHYNHYQNNYQNNQNNFSKEKSEFDDQEYGPHSSLHAFLTYNAYKSFKKIKRFFTSFMGIHYIYFACVVILSSIIAYPVKNYSYTNILFTSMCHATQAGLNVVLFNDFKLYQQITFYMVTFLTTPIFVHSFVVFFRLYCFERYFKNIKVNSKLQSKMRRTATMARAESRDTADFEQGLASGSTAPHRTLRYRLNSSFFGTKGHNNPFPQPHDVQTATFDSQTSGPVSGHSALGVGAGSGAGSGGVDRDTAATAASRSQSPATQMAKPEEEKDIRFADLPQPPKRKQSFRPQDMYRSINMLQRERRYSGDVGDGPALVIKSPRDMDMENEERERNERLQPHSVPDFRSIGALTNETTMVDENELRDRDDDEEDETRFTRSSTKFDNDSQSRPGGSLKRRFSLATAFRRSKTMDEAVSKKEKEEEEFRRSNTEQLPRKKSNFRRTKTFDSLFRRDSQDQRVEPTMSTNYLSWEPTVGRNSAFIGLTEEQKEELGGVEYRSLKLLAKVLIGYYFGIGILGIVSFLPYSYLKSNFTRLFYSEGYNPAWFSIYQSMSAFANLGMALPPESFTIFDQSAYIPIWSMFLIVVGNTGFPCFLRFILWIMFKLSPKYGHMHESLGFLLDHPRRCFTLLFPSRATWILFLILVALNSVDLVLFIILDLTSGPIKSIPVGYRIMCGLFQAISTRTCGLTIVSMADVHPAVRVSYMIMMYISVFPVAISMRRTNVYEEQSLGVYYDPDDTNPENHSSFIATHLRRQLAFDLWFMFLALFCLCITEDGKLRNGTFDIFDCLFEIVSAYGTVGVSMGLKDSDLATSGAFSNLGKLIIIAVMYRGRHRGLPYAIDRAIMFKGENMKKADTIQANRARQRHQLSMADSAERTMSRSPSRTRSTGFAPSAPTNEAPDHMSANAGLRNRGFPRAPSQAIVDDDDLDN